MTMSQYEQNEDIEFIRHVYRASSPTVTRQENRIKELEELLDIERDTKLRMERTNGDLAAQLEEMDEQIRELSTSSSQYNDTIRRKDADLQRLRKEFEKFSLEMEMSDQDNRKKNHNLMMERAAEIEGIQKQKVKCEKEKMMLLKELEATLVQLDSATKNKINAESKLENFEAQLTRLKFQADEQEKHLREISTIKAKLCEENMSLKIQVKEITHQNANIKKSKSSLDLQLEEIKKHLEDEIKCKEVLQSHAHQLQGDNDQLRLQFEDESDNFHRLQAQVSKLNSDLMILKTKSDKDLQNKFEEFEELKRKSTARINELLDDLSREHMKVSSSEKAKQQLSLELNDLYGDIERITNENEGLVQTLKSIEAINKEINNRLDEVDVELVQTRNGLAKVTSENSRLKSNLDEEEQKNSSLNKDNQSLLHHLKEEKDQSRALHKELTDTQMTKNQLEVDRANLVSALEETKEMLIDAEHKNQLSHNTLLQLKLDMEQRLQEKDDELVTIKKNTQRTIEELSHAIDEVETKYKTEISKLKKRCEGQIKEIQNAFNDALKDKDQLSEELKDTLEKYQEVEQTLEEERRDYNVMQEKLISAEKRKSQMQGDLEDSNRLLEASDKTRKKIQIEIEEISMKLAESVSHINFLHNEKRKLEGEILVLHNDVDDALSSKMETEDRVIKQGNEISRLTDEMKLEHENHKKAETARKGLANELREMKLRFDEREANASKDILKNAQIFQDRIKDLDSELENERARCKEAQIQLRKQDRSIREIQQLAEEDRRAVIDFQQLLDGAHGKLKTYKRQIDELEVTSLDNLNKYKRAQKLIDEAEHRASIAERRAGSSVNHTVNLPSSSISLSTYVKQSSTR